MKMEEYRLEQEKMRAEREVQLEAARVEREKRIQEERIAEESRRAEMVRQIESAKFEREQKN